MTGESGSAGCDSGASSPRNKVKILCSHGGKILPRPGDGNLKYVGGETRVVAVPCEITLSELMKKLTALTDGDMVLKYQLVPEDLDTLISVRSDEDLKHMFDEHDRHDSGGPMLRAFLFPSKQVVSESQGAASETGLEQRYIDAINGMTHASPGARLASTPSRAVGIPSACSSPKTASPDRLSVDVAQESLVFSSSRNTQVSMQRVGSSPSINSPSNLQNHSNGIGSLNVQQYDHSYYYHNQNQNQQQQHPHGHPSVRLQVDPQIGVWIGRPSPNLSLKPDIGRVNNGLNHYHPTSRHNSPIRNGGCSKCGYHDECTPYPRIRVERSNSISRTPSPR